MHGDKPLGQRAHLSGKDREMIRSIAVVSIGIFGVFTAWGDELLASYEDHDSGSPLLAIDDEEVDEVEGILNPDGGLAPLEDGAVEDGEALDIDWRPSPIDSWRGGRYGRSSENMDVRIKFISSLTDKGVELGMAEVVGMAMGEDEISNLPPAMVGHLVTALLHIESDFKKSQVHLSLLDSGASFLVSTALPIEQGKIHASVNVALSPVGVLYGNDAIVKRISQALSRYLQRQLADPFPWTYEERPRESKDVADSFLGIDNDQDADFLSSEIDTVAASADLFY